MNNLRIVLDTDTRIPMFWEMDENGETIQSLCFEEALAKMREGLPCTFAINHETDTNSHYETNNCVFFKV